MMHQVLKKKRAAYLVMLLACSACTVFSGFSASAKGIDTEGYQRGDEIQVETGLGDGFESMKFICLDPDYQGGYLFVADEVIPYAVSTRYAEADNDYGTSDVRTWLNLYLADTLSVSERIMPVSLDEADDSILDRVFCLSVEEIRNPEYREIVRKTWIPQRGNRYYWTRSKRENTTNQAYMVQYNGHIASSRVSLTQAGVRPAFVLGKGNADVSQGRIWYEGDTQERTIHGVPYTFRCVDPNYCDAASNRIGALFLCDSVIGGDECTFDESSNGWASSDVRRWLNDGIEDTDGIAKAVTTNEFTYAGKSSDYDISVRRFSKRKLPSEDVKDDIFCLSLEEALRYGDWLWKLEGSETDNYINPGSYTMGYWLRTPAVKDGRMCYAVTYDGRVAPEEVQNKKIGIRPAFVAVQE